MKLLMFLMSLGLAKALQVIESVLPVPALLDNNYYQPEQVHISFGGNVNTAIIAQNLIKTSDE